MSDSKQIKKNRRLVLEVENHAINKKVEIWQRKFNSDDMLGGLNYAGEWEGRKLEVMFQHLGNGYLNVAVYQDGSIKTMVVCKASNEHGMTIAAALNDNEMLNIRVGD